jgi:hypothetical protein
MNEHMIRLRGGWTLKSPEGETRQSLPYTELPVEPAGFVLLRPFNAPKGLSPRETVSLRVESVPGVERILLNERVILDGKIADLARREIDVTSVLTGRCLLALEVGGGIRQTTTEGWGHVALVIRSDESIGEA